MPNFIKWAQRHPHAAAELMRVLSPGLELPDGRGDGKSEAWAQQQVRFNVAQRGGMMWRNNVGAIPAELHINCPKCHFRFVQKQQMIRWGLANESKKQNKLFKSADLIGVTPVLVTPAHVGQLIGQFTSIEMKKPGWVFNSSDEHEAAQAAWAALVNGLGGSATFSTGVF